MSLPKQEGQLESKVKKQAPESDQDPEADKKARKEAEKEKKKKADLAAQEAKRANESEKAAEKGKTVATVNLIPMDSMEARFGSITLWFNPDIGYNKILQLISALSEDSNIQITSQGGSPKKGSWVQLSIERPVTLYQVLYNVPVVQHLIKKGNDIQIILHDGE